MTNTCGLTNRKIQSTLWCQIKITQAPNPVRFLSVLGSGIQNLELKEGTHVPVRVLNFE